MSEDTLYGFSEASINVTLAELLSQRNLIAGAELITKGDGEPRRPDVMLNHQGFRIILEGKIEKKTARKELETQCKKRVTEDLCDISLGVVYRLPQANNDLFTIPKLQVLLTQAEYDIAVWGPDVPEPRLLQDWVTQDLDGLAGVVRDAVHEAASADVLSEAIDRIRNTLDAASSFILGAMPKGVKRLAEDLAPSLELPKPKNQQERIRTLKMAFLVLMDATIFYDVLSSRKPLKSVESLKKKHGSHVAALRKAFENALDINYAAVFEIAVGILDLLPPEADKAVEKVTETAFYIATQRVLLKHDLMGRVYHKLLFKELAKHLATYYTAVTSAWLLAKVAIATPGADWSNNDLSDLEEIRKLHVSDFACGSGTLLSAAYRELDRLYTDAVYRGSKEPDRDALHTILLDKVISGFDVMLYAAHIATLTLAMHNPDSLFNKGHIYVLPFGDRKEATGSVEFLVKDSVRARTTALQYAVKGKAQVDLDLPPQGYDLLIMNPPFARSCGDNLMFGSVTGKKRREQMKERLSDILKQANLSGIGQAGLGAVFVAIADRFVKRAGRIAFVLPRNLLSGVSWKRIRELLVRTTQLTTWHGGGFHLEYIMLSTEPGSYNFSENTDLSECMFVARKLRDGEKPGRTVVAIFDRKPKTVFESRAVATVLQKQNQNGQSSDSFDILLNPTAADGQMKVGNTRMGRVYTLSPSLLTDNVDNWGRLCAFAMPELTRIAYRLRTTGEFALDTGLAVRVPLKAVGKLFEVGPDRRQIHSAFNIDDTGAYDALWGREAKMNSLTMAPNSKLSQKPGVDIRALVKTASRLVITERIRLDTTPLVSLLCNHPVLSNVWWTLLAKDSIMDSEDIEKVSALWLNSTPGLLLQFAELQVTEGGWAATKKASLEALPTLNFSKLTESQRAALVALFDELSTKQFPVLADQFADAAEGKGWRWELDSRLLEILSGEKIDPRDLHPLYGMLKDEAAHW
ncbi:hypothetical protein J7J84_02700 [bacterium]|nr:hypothetical protein [bacterium]